MFLRVGFKCSAGRSLKPSKVPLEVHGHLLEIVSAFTQPNALTWLLGEDVSPLLVSLSHSLTSHPPSRRSWSGAHAHSVPQYGWLLRIGGTGRMNRRCWHHPYWEQERLSASGPAVTSQNTSREGGGILGRRNTQPVQRAETVDSGEPPDCGEDD